MFIETPLYEAGQVLSLASAALANAALGSEFYLQEINDVHSTLRTLSRYEFLCSTHQLLLTLFGLDSGLLRPLRWPPSPWVSNTTMVRSENVSIVFY